MKIQKLSGTGSSALARVVIFTFSAKCIILRLSGVCVSSLKDKGWDFFGSVLCLCSVFCFSSEAELYLHAGNWTGTVSFLNRRG